MTNRIILFILTGLFFSSCLLTDTKSCDFVNSYSISKGLYIEKYKTFNAGVYGEVTTCYLTDSVNFRQIIGSYDEHERFHVVQNGDKIVAYNFQPADDSDTTERKILSKTELLTYHHNTKDFLSVVPIFGKNTIKCDTNFYPASSWKTDDGHYWSQIQYKCGVDDFENAVFYTDSSTFSIFVGVYIPGSMSNNYSVKVNKNNTFEFFNVESKSKNDTVKSVTYLLTDLRKGKLNKVCE